MEGEEKRELTEEEIDYLTEMMNIGSGNAGMALSQLLQIEVDMVIPKLHVIRNIKDAEDFFQEKAQVLACIKMQMIGDIRGDISFMVPKKQIDKFLTVATKAMTGIEDVTRDRDYKITVLSEAGNILAGVYLGAVFEFCRLNIYHTVPGYKLLSVGDLFEGIFGQDGHSRILLVENEFVIGKERLTTYLLLVIYPGGYVEKLLKSINAARKTYGDTGKENK